MASFIIRHNNTIAMRVLKLHRRRRAAQMQLAVRMRAQRQVVFDITGVVPDRMLHRIGQLTAIRECLLHRMPEQVFAAHVEQVFCGRVEVNDARLLVQQDNGRGEVFERKSRKVRHTFLRSRKHARWENLLEFGQFCFERFDILAVQLDLVFQRLNLLFVFRHIAISLAVLAPVDFGRIFALFQALPGFLE